MTLLSSLTLFLGLSDIVNLDLAANTGPNAIGRNFGRLRMPVDARIEDHPYQVSLRVNDVHRCGGSIISATEILTAAHCVVNVPINQLTVRVGATVHSQGQPVAVRRMEIHSCFNFVKMTCDVAILTLSQTLVFGTRVRPIELSKKLPLAGAAAHVTGWGARNDGDLEGPDTLKKISMLVISQGECRRWYPNDNISQQAICANYENAGVCQGDSGNPLVETATGKQIGVVSWGLGCSQPMHPIVFASLPALIH